jgi:hypothetical protein
VLGTELIATLHECTEKLRTLQNTVIDLNKELFDISRLIDKTAMKLNL